MPALPMITLDRREVNPGRTFSIIFAVVAFLVILGCLILVIILPKLRKKPRTLPGSRYPVVPNYPHPFAPPPRFPSHPAMLRGFRTQTTDSVQRYDPRVESPFPSSTARLNHTSGPAHNAIHNHGLFTSTQCCFVMRRRQQVPSRHKPRAAARVDGPDPRHFTTFSAKHDYILPVPEPLVLKPRPAGRPPPLTRQLEQFPMPLPLSSSRNGGLVHPSKLFQELEQRHSDTTAETLGTPCPAPQKPKKQAGVEMSLMGTVTPGTRPSRDGPKDSIHLDRMTLALELDHALQTPASQPTNSDEVEISKSSYRPKHEGLQRMGTLTRPKTPVAERRNWFDRAASDATKEKSTSSNRLYTPASNPFTTPGLTSTPPTSPRFSAEKTTPPLTPSRANLEQLCLNMPSHAHRRTPSSVILHSAEKLTDLPPATPNKRDHRAAKGSPQGKGFNKRSNIGRIKLVSWSKLRPIMRGSRRYSGSSLSTIFRPILGPRSQYSQGASSVYSRDARRLTFLEAIDLPVKGTASSRNDAARNNNCPSTRRSGTPHKQSASIDHLKTKIDNWDLHTSNLDRSMFTPSAVKRSISDTGPRRATVQDFTALELDNSTQSRSVPVIQVGRSSDDVFGLEADGFRGDQASILLKRMAHVGQGTAPGGGDWI